MAKNRRKIRGFKQVKSNLNKEIMNIKGRSLKGLIEAQILIRNDMEKTSPTVPVDLRNLDHSYFAVTGKSVIAGGGATFEGKGSAGMSSDHTAAIAATKAMAAAKQDPYIILGFSANYAVFVHEMEGVNWSRPGSGGKFLESALLRNEQQILQIIRDNAEIK